MSSEAPLVTNPMVWDWESRRNDILNKIHTYPFVGLVIHEALQNAVDSFFDLDSSEFIHRESPTINITFDLNEGIIQVSDNGTGIDVKNLNGLLKTNFSPKGNLLKNAELRDARRALKGSQGIGIKLTMLCTRKFELRTVYSSSESNMTWGLEFDNWHEKLEKTDDPNVFLPEYPEVTPTTDDVGTILRYQIHPEFMHQQSGQKFSLNHFLLELIRDELVRQNIKLDEVGKLIHVSKENNQLPEFHVTTSVAELVTSSLIHGGTTRYLLDLNHALIEEEDYSSIEEKISINEQECEKSKLYIESKKTEPEIISEENKKISRLDKLNEILKREIELRKSLAREGQKPPRIELKVKIIGDGESLCNQVTQILKELSSSSSTEDDETEDEVEDRESEQSPEENSLTGESVRKTEIMKPEDEKREVLF